jgi:hypothetical protein
VVERKNGRLLLDYIASDPTTPESGTICLLLRDTGDPNGRFQGISMWQ